MMKMNLGIGVSALLVGSCAGISTLQDGTDSTAPAMASFTEEISGTTVTFEMIAIPKGEITVTDAEGVTHTKTVGPFWIEKTETTWDAYDVYVFETDRGASNPEADAVSRPSKPYIPPDRGYGHEGYAALSMTFDGAKGYCEWLSAKTGRTYRLATTAEWEYAARAGGSPMPEEIQSVAWCEENSDEVTHPVGKKPANAWGLHDMFGNVSEWCVDMQGKPVTAGGHYLLPAEECSASYRAYKTYDWQMMDPQIPKSPWWMSDASWVGCRVIRVPE